VLDFTSTASYFLSGSVSAQRLIPKLEPTKVRTLSLMICWACRICLCFGVHQSVDVLTSIVTRGSFGQQFPFALVQQPSEGMYCSRLNNINISFTIEV
jgi:hypothetical protein